MNSSLVVLAVILIWGADKSEAPRLITVEQSSAAVCKANLEGFKAKLLGNPAIRYIDAKCVELHRGETA